MNFDNNIQVIKMNARVIRNIILPINVIKKKEENYHDRSKIVSKKSTTTMDFMTWAISIPHNKGKSLDGRDSFQGGALFFLFLLYLLLPCQPSTDHSTVSIYTYIFIYYILTKRRHRNYQSKRPRNDFSREKYQS